MKQFHTGSRAHLGGLLLCAAPILLLLAASLFLFAFLHPSEMQEETPVFYTVKIQRIREDIAARIQAGDPVIDAVGKYPLGTVAQITRTPASEEFYSTEQGQMILASTPGYADLLLVLQASADTLSPSVQIGGYRLMIGMDISLRLPDFCGVGICTSIKEGVPA